MRIIPITTEFPLFDSFYFIDGYSSLELAPPLNSHFFTPFQSFFLPPSEDIGILEAVENPQIQIWIWGNVHWATSNLFRI